jgi:hypothetical protein
LGARGGEELEEEEAEEEAEAWRGGGGGVVAGSVLSLAVRCFLLLASLLSFSSPASRVPKAVFVLGKF